MPKVRSAPIIGLPLANGWSQVTKNETGNFVCAFSISGPSAGNIGRDTSNQILYSSLSSASELHQFVLDLIKRLRETNNYFQVAASLHQDDQMILLTYNGFILLKRGEKSGKIIESEGEIKVIQGKSNEEDILVLMTSQAQKFAEEIKLRFVQGYDIDSIITSIVPGIQDQENSSLSSLTFVNQIKTIPEEETHEFNLEFSTAEDYQEQESLKGILEPKITTDLMPSVDDTVDPILENIEKDSFGESQPEETIEKEKQTKSRLELSQDKPAFSAQKGVTEMKDFQTASKDDSTNKDVKIKIDVNFMKYAQKLFNLLKNLFIKLFSLIKKSVNKITPFTKNLSKQTFALIKQAKPSKDVYVNNFNKKKVARVAFVALSILIVVISFVMMKKFAIDKQKRLANEKMANAVMLVDAAQKNSDNDPISARENITTAINELEALKNDLKDQKTAVKIVDEKLEAAKQFYEEISGKDEFKELALFFDLRDKESDFVTNKADLNEKTAVFLDTEAKKMITINLENKETQVTNLEKYEKLTDLNLTNKIHLLGSGVHEFSLDNLNEAKTIKEEGDSDRDGKYLSSFGPYLYIFNPEKRNIYRYAKQEDKLSDPIGWLISKKDLEFAQINSMAIDGDLWLTTKQGEIKKFTKGEESEKFKLSGLNEPFSTPTKIYTKENLEYLYVLEPSKRRLVILTKEGAYFREIKSASLASTTTVIVSEEIKKAFAISGSIIFEIAL